MSAFLVSWGAAWLFFWGVPFVFLAHHERHLTKASDALGVTGVMAFVALAWLVGSIVYAVLA